ncbi:hypothetical protein [Polyangium sp. 15x6]|uniref:hypothetical protein n=1 Tax=Polyangium sp. 15x6 TaxID=3042687 RepID=UPI00249B008E|nr:hypothetical protein [Polyangium sp. 15x6]MDI3290892.1 hypothetical protein [Polyangium sp. 15x6]
MAGKEVSARALFGSILREQGRALAARGQRELAIAALVEAKEHPGAAAKEGARGPLKGRGGQAKSMGGP